MPKNKAAQALAKLRHASMTPEHRKKVAKKALKARWDKYRKNKKLSTPDI